MTSIPRRTVGRTNLSGAGPPARRRSPGRRSPRGAGRRFSSTGASAAMEGTANQTSSTCVTSGKCSHPFPSKNLRPAPPLSCPTLSHFSSHTQLHSRQPLTRKPALFCPTCPTSASKPLILRTPNTPVPLPSGTSRHLSQFNTFRKISPFLSFHLPNSPSDFS